MNQTKHGFPVNRFRFLAAGFTLLFLSVAAAVVSAQVVSRVDTPPPPKPNIILINLDDATYEQVQKYLPDVRKFFEEKGIIFRRAYVADPLCCPSRASLLTGLYAHNHGIKYNEESRGGGAVHFHKKGLQNSTIATWLDGAGYTTSLVGKYLNEYKKLGPIVPPGWDDWHALFEQDKYFPYFEFSIVDNGTIADYGSDITSCTKRDEGGPGGGAGGSDCPNKKYYSTDVLADRAAAFLENAQTPFFLYFNPWNPHSPGTPPLRYENLYPGLQAPRPPNFNEKNVSDKPNWIKSQPLLSENVIQMIDDLYAKGARGLMAVDDAFVRMIASLEARGELENTVIILTSDNGFSFGEHRWAMDKRSPYEESIHVPLAVSYPKMILEPRSDDHLISHIDITATITDLAGAVPTTPVNGRSFKPLLSSGGRDAPFRDGVLSESWAANSSDDSCTGTGGKCSYPTFQLMVARPSPDSLFKYIKLKSGEEELYNLNEDPYELHNAIRNSYYADELQYLRDLLNRLANE